LNHSSFSLLYFLRCCFCCFIHTSRRDGASTGPSVGPGSTVLTLLNV